MTSAPPSRLIQLVLVVLAASALAVVLAVLPYRTFELDRFFVPKEAVLHATALTAGLLALVGVRRWRLSAVDDVLAAFLALSLLSAIAAPNGWLAFRAVSLTISSLVIFWACRRLAAAGLARPLIVVLVCGTMLGTATALLQAYGVSSDSFSLSRAPGGTFGNRNFMAHLAAIGLPLVVALTLQTRNRFGALAGAAAVLVLTGAVVITRCRAAWLGMLVSALFFVVAGLWLGGLGRDGLIRRRLILLTVGGVLGVALALAVPNNLNWRSDSPYLETLQDVANYKEGSGKGRLIQYQNTIRMTLAHPLLGVGPGNWAVVYPRFAPRRDPSLDQDDGMTANPWPSSDWMTFLSERGPLATLLLLLALLSLGVRSWRWWHDGPRRLQTLDTLALPAVLLAAITCGAFDAVLVLPIPALYVWAAAGLLAPIEAGGRVVELAGRRYYWVAGCLALLLGAATLRSGLQGAAMGLYEESWRMPEAERAARLDPGSYRIRIFLAQRYYAKGDCGRTRIQAEAARQLFPEAPRPRRLLRSCGVNLPPGRD